MKSKKLLFFGAVLLCLALGISAMASSSDILDTDSGSGDTTNTETGNTPPESSDSDESSGVLESSAATQSPTVVETPTPSATATAAASTTTAAAVATTSVSSKTDLFAATAVTYDDLVKVMTSSSPAISTYSRSAGASRPDTTRYTFYVNTGNGYKFVTLQDLHVITKQMNASVVIEEADVGQVVYHGAGGTQGAELSDVTAAPLTIAKQG